MRHGAGSAREHEAVADLIVVKERLVILVHLAGLQLACAPPRLQINQASSKRYYSLHTPRFRAASLQHGRRRRYSNHSGDFMWF